MRNTLGVFYEDGRFAALFSDRGRSAEAPWRLALVTVLQFAEGLSDRQAAEAGPRGHPARIDWKYALGLPLEDPGFDYSVLPEFRTRLFAGHAENLLLEALLETCKERGLLRKRGRARTDSTHVLGALRTLNRLEQVAETMRAALDALAAADPAWLAAQSPAEWFGRYGRRIEDDRLPQSQEARAAFARQVGEDGFRLLTAVFAPDAPPPCAPSRRSRSCARCGSSATSFGRTRSVCAIPGTSRPPRIKLSRPTSLKRAMRPSGR